MYVECLLQLEKYQFRTTLYIYGMSHNTLPIVFIEQFENMQGLMTHSVHSLRPQFLTLKRTQHSALNPSYIAPLHSCFLGTVKHINRYLRNISRIIDIEFEYFI